MSCSVFIAVTVALRRTDFYSLRDLFISGHVILGNDSCNFCRNKTARQAARNIACALENSDGPDIRKQGAIKLTK